MRTLGSEGNERQDRGGKSAMIGYHVTTDKKLARYQITGAILPPVRFWPNELTARRWAKRTGRNIILQIEYTQAYPLPDHKPAKWTGELIRDFVEVKNGNP